MGTKSIVDRLIELDNQVHSAMPIKDIYSKLFFRTILWFVFFLIGYLVVSSF